MSQIRETSEIRQQQIVEAARSIVTARGIEALTIREIAKEVGISEADIYRHFASKKVILLFLIEDVEKTLMEMVERAASEEREPVQSLENVLKAHLSYVEQRRGVSLLVVAETLRLADKDLRKRMFEVVNRYIGRIAEILAQGVRSGHVRKDIDLDTAALTFFALVHATVTLWALSDASFSLTERHESLWESYLAGIAEKAFESGP
ncbi:MAG: TetR/AcrR family transcriptional regulator [Chloroflexi bacterium]|nr:TetR/AcrR family transcriptional regulator [Chloroflexota bacterium]